MPRGPLHALRPDQESNPALRAQMGHLRGAIVAAAEKDPLPDRFRVDPDPESPAMVVTDTETGRKARVPLFAYGNLRSALSALFA